MKVVNQLLLYHAADPLGNALSNRLVNGRKPSEPKVDGLGQSVALHGKRKGLATTEKYRVGQLDTLQIHAHHHGH